MVQLMPVPVLVLVRVLVMRDEGGFEKKEAGVREERTKKQAGRAGQLRADLLETR